MSTKDWAENLTAEEKESYLRVDRLVHAYRDNEPGAADELIKAFEGFLVRFYQILVHGRCDPNDYSTRIFLRFFIRSQYIRQRIHALQLGMIVQELDRTAKLVRYQLNTYEAEEIHHEMIICLLQMAHNYTSNDGNPRFHNYVVKSYPSILAKRVRDMVKDPLVFSTEIQFMNPVWTFEDGTETYLIDVIADPRPISYEPTDDDWVETAEGGSYRFEDLTPMERSILLWRYDRKWTYRRLGEEFGITWGEARAIVQDCVERILPNLERPFSRMTTETAVVIEGRRKQRMRFTW